MTRVVAALIRRDGELLICQRARNHAMPLKWEFPGGKVEDGETAPAALHRELMEELGIEAEVGREVAALRHDYGDGGSVALQFFLVERYSGDMKNLIFHDVRWEKLEKLPEYDFLEADLRLVADLAAGKVL